MHLMDLFVENEFKINFNEEIIYDKDDPWGDEDWVPTVEFELYGTPGLNSLADRARIRSGFHPIHPMDGFVTNEQLDAVAWYNFYVTLSRWGDNPLDHDLIFTVNNSDCSDDGKMYEIEMTPDERLRVFRALDKQCRLKLGKSCYDLLNESEAAMKGEPHDESV